MISKQIHWTIPDISKTEILKPEAASNVPAFCLHVSPITNWQYNVFRTGILDSPTRQDVEQLINKFD